MRLPVSVSQGSAPRIRSSVRPMAERAPAGQVPETEHLYRDCALFA